MTKLEDFQAIKTAKYTNLVSFIKNPEPTKDMPNYELRLAAIEDWIAEQLLL